MDAGKKKYLSEDTNTKINTKRSSSSDGNLCLLCEQNLFLLSWKIWEQTNEGWEGDTEKYLLVWCEVDQ